MASSLTDPEESPNAVLRTESPERKVEATQELKKSEPSAERVVRVKEDARSRGISGSQEQNVQDPASLFPRMDPLTRRMFVSRLMLSKSETSSTAAYGRITTVGVILAVVLIVIGAVLVILQGLGGYNLHLPWPDVGAWRYHSIPQTTTTVT